MKFYLQKIRDNIFNPSYYEEIVSKPLKASFKYYLKMAMWLALIYTAFVSVFFVPEFMRLLKEVSSSLASAYPADLKVHFQNGEASVNMPEPIIVPLPQTGKEFFNGSHNGRDIKNLMVIDTRTVFTSEDFKQDQALFVLKKDAMAGLGNDSEVRVTDIPGGNIIIDKQDIQKIADRFQTFSIALVPISVLVIYLLALIFFTLTLGSIIMVALFAWLLLYVAKRDLTFKQCLGLTLHAATLALCVNFFIFILYPSLSINFPFLATFSLLVLYLNLIRKPAVPVVVPAVPAEIPKDTIEEGKEEEIKN